MPIDDPLTGRLLSCAVAVHKGLGGGFLEKVYENALVYECRKAGLEVKPQYPIRVFYDQTLVGEFFADLLVNGELLVELKAVRTLDDVHMAQCLNYLKATGLKRCLILNFANTTLEIKRIVR